MYKFDITKYTRYGAITRLILIIALFSLFFIPYAIFTNPNNVFNNSSKSQLFISILIIAFSYILIISLISSALLESNKALKIFQINLLLILFSTFCLTLIYFLFPFEDNFILFAPISNLLVLIIILLFPYLEIRTKITTHLTKQ
jgi:hypothetical protein